MKSIINHLAILCLLSAGIGSAPGQTFLSSETMSGANFQFVINGSPSNSVDIEASTNLVNWTNLGMVTLSGGGTYTYTDTAAVNFTNRFYCVQQGTNCSSNTVGFITIIVPAKNPDNSSAFIAFANQLNNPTGSNDLDVLFDALPIQSQVQTWNLANQSFSTSLKGGSPAYWNFDVSLDPSQGSGLAHAGGTNRVKIVFVGEAPKGPQINTNFPTIAGNLSLMSSILPRAGTLDDLVFPAFDGDQIIQWNSSTQQWVTTATRTNGYWSPVAPTVQIGESFLLQSGSSSNRVWIEDFSSQPCGQEQPWSFIQIGDLHAGAYLGGVAWTNTLNSILASNQAWGLKLVVSPGDCYEADTNYASWSEIGAQIGGQTMTNGMWRIKAAGISWMNVPGNHDADYDPVDPIGKTNIIFWNDVFGTNFYASDPYWFSNRVAGDTRDLAFKLTNGTTKVLFVGLSWGEHAYFATTDEVFTAYSTNCAWASNLARAYPDHLVVPVMHYFVDTNGMPSTQDAGRTYEGPGIVSWNALKSATNLMMVLSGHVRERPMTKSSLQCDDGHMIESIKFNTQTGPAEGATNVNNGSCFVLYTVYPSEHYVRGRVFEADWGRFMTNGEFTTSGFVNDWTFPFKRLP
jgi:hypothetical protein